MSLALFLSGWIVGYFTYKFFALWRITLKTIQGYKIHRKETKEGVVSLLEPLEERKSHIVKAPTPQELRQIEDEKFRQAHGL